MEEVQELENLRVKLQTFSFDAVQNGRVPENKFDLDKKTKYVKRMQVTGPSKSKIYFRGSLGLKISNDEIYSTDTPADIFVSSVGVDLDGRWMDLGNVSPGNGVVEIEYNDVDNSIQSWDGGYKVEVVFWTLVEK